MNPHAELELESARELAEEDAARLDDYEREQEWRETSEALP